MKKLKIYLILSVMMTLAACGGDEAPSADQVSEVNVEQTVEAAVAETVAANTAVTQTDDAAEEVTIPPTATALPTLTAVPTEPPPPTNTVVPTVTIAPTETAVPATDTPEATAVPPTNTPAPVQATQPPPPPPPPPAPTVGENILANGSFEDGWYNLNGIPELQIPNGWGYEWDIGPTGFGSEEWDKWVRPETRVLPDFQLPANERPLFIRDGIYTIKMFKGNGAISYRMFQDIELQPGTYVFQVNIFPDLVTAYVDNSKQPPGDPAAGEIRFIAPDGGTGWIFPAFSQWNTLEHTFTIDQPQVVRVGVGIRGRYALANNGWFLDEWSLRRVQ